jgi:hypothetical protein
MPEVRTYEPLATTTLGSSAATINFTSISGSYTDLVIVISGVSSSSNNIFGRFNSDSGSNYSVTRLSGSGSSVLTDRSTNQTYLTLSNYGWPTTTSGEHIATIQIMNYSNANTFKTVINRSNRANAGLDAIINLWRSTSAITSVSLSTNGFSGATNWSSGTTATLYGILAS